MEKLHNQANIRLQLLKSSLTRLSPSLSHLSHLDGTVWAQSAHFTQVLFDTQFWYRFTWVHLFSVSFSSKYVYMHICTWNLSTYLIWLNWWMYQRIFDTKYMYLWSDTQDTSLIHKIHKCPLRTNLYLYTNRLNKSMHIWYWIT